MRILTLRELDDWIRADEHGNEQAGLVTFDDGYRDNFDLAVPILKELNVPATFFIPTGFLESPSLPWWDHVAYAVKKRQSAGSEVKCCPGGDDPPITVDLSALERSAAILVMIRAVLDGKIADIPWFLQQLAAEADVDIDTESLGRALFMSWEQVRTARPSDAGLSIGSHGTVTTILGNSTLNRSSESWCFPRRFWRNGWGGRSAVLAYPFGWSGTYTQATKTAGERQAIGWRFPHARVLITLTPWITLRSSG